MGKCISIKSHLVVLTTEAAAQTVHQLSFLFLKKKSSGNKPIFQYSRYVHESYYPFCQIVIRLSKKKNLLPIAKDFSLAVYLEEILTSPQATTLTATSLKSNAQQCPTSLNSLLHPIQETSTNYDPPYFLMLETNVIHLQAQQRWKINSSSCQIC